MIYITDQRKILNKIPKAKTIGIVIIGSQIAARLPMFAQINPISV